MFGRYGRYCAPIVGLAVLLATGPANAQNGGQGEQLRIYQQQIDPRYVDQRTGGTLVCRKIGDGQKPSYECDTAKQRSIRERIGRWFFRLLRDPIAVLTLALFLLGGWQIEISRRTAKRQLRAYLFADSVILYDSTNFNPPQPQHANHPHVIVRIKNTGSTPANEVYHSARIEVRPRSEEHLLSQPKVDRDSVSYLPSESTADLMISLNRQLAPQEINGIVSGTHAIYIMGRIEYIDAFNKKRFANYRRLYAGPYPSSNYNVFFCDQGNEAN